MPGVDFHLDVTPGKIQAGIKVNLTCEEGYQLEGRTMFQQESICTPEGIWYPPFDPCIGRTN